MDLKTLSTSRWIAVQQLLLVAGFAFSCAEKPSPEPAAKEHGKSGKSDDPDKDSEQGGDEDGDGAIEEGEGQTGQAFDLCTNGLKASTKLAGFESYVKILCDEKKLQGLRKPEAIFTGADNKIFEDKVVKGDLQTSFMLTTSALYDCNPEDYWNMTRLQFTKPKVFGENYLKDPDAKMLDVNADAHQSTYRYQNSSDEGGAVDYTAKTIFVTLKAGRAWVAATTKLETKETMESLKALIIVNKTSAGKTEVISLSDQIYKHASGQGQTYYDRAMRSLKEEQKNGFTNAKSASKAKALLGE